MSKIEAKLEEYFDGLTRALAEEDTLTVQLYLSRLSPYVEYFNQDQADTYYEADNCVEYFNSGRMIEPSELDEWQDFDPEC